MKRRMKVELMSAVAMALALAFLAVYSNLPRRPEIGGGQLFSESTQKLKDAFRISGQSTQQTQQVVSENIQGELRKGEFETTVQGVRDVASVYGGRVPVLHMGYDNDVWSGTLTCKVPSDNVTSFTFDVRKLIMDHGKVTHISIDVSEVEVNQTQTGEKPLSEVSMYLYEQAGGASPLLDQVGGIVPVLTTGLVWIAEGLIVGVPLCFASLGVVVLVDRGIIPVWKKQFRNRNMAKERTESINS
jgi:hypothetical protein